MAEVWREQGAEPRTEAQHRMLCAVCGCLVGLRWKRPDGTPIRLSSDSWRHFLSGQAAGFVQVAGYDRGDGHSVVVMLGRSSKLLTKTQCTEAITMGLHIGDHPEEQGLQSQRVRWSDAVLLGLGFQPDELNQ